MKFVSLFTKAPQYQRFNYNPRFYDAKKEEMLQRESRIKSELEKEKSVEEDVSRHHSRIAGSFHSARRRSKTPTTSPNAAVLRTGVILFLVLLMMAYLTWGKVALYSFFLLIPLYIYLKFKK